MKVLVLTTTFPRWKDDSTPMFVYELSKRLGDEGLEIIVLAPHHGGAKFYEEMDGLKVYRFPYFYPTKYQRLCYEGGVLPNLKRSFLARVQLPFLCLSELIYAVMIVRKEKIAAVHSHWIIPNGIVGAIIRKIWKIPHLSTAHAADVIALDKLPFKTKISSFILQNSDATTADGSHIKERLEEMLVPEVRGVMKEKILIQPMGVNIKRFEGLDKKVLREKYSLGSGFVVLFVGRFAEKKGIEYLLDAMETVVSSHKDLKLLLAGSGPLEGNLRKKVSEMEIDPYVNFMGWANMEQLAELYVLSDIVAVPSIVTSSGDTEGMPTVIVEAMGAGKPVIASDVGGIKDVVINGHNGFLVEEKNSGALAERIIELIENSDLRNTLSQNAGIEGEKYDWSIVGKRYLELLESKMR